MKQKTAAADYCLPSGGSSSSSAWIASNAALSSASLPTESINSGCRDMSSLVNPKPSPLKESGSPSSWSSSTWVNQWRRMRLVRKGPHIDDDCTHVHTLKCNSNRNRRGTLRLLHQVARIHDSHLLAVHCGASADSNLFPL